jgi:putative DNA primase/helicase
MTEKVKEFKPGRGGQRKRGDEPPVSDHGEVSDRRPVIRIKAGEQPRVLDEIEAALKGLKLLYRQENRLVRPVLSQVAGADGTTTISHRLAPVTVPHLGELANRAARYEKWDGRAEAFVTTDLPLRYADAYAARDGEWRLARLDRVINAPMLRADGSLLDRPGYDAATRLLFDPRGAKFPRVPEHPSREEALIALAQLKRVFATFPFVDAQDLSVALVALLTALIRPSLYSAPIFVFRSPAAGTGKTLIVDSISVCATGRRAPVTAQGSTDEELEKRLIASVLAGDAIVLIDNCSRDLGGDFLCQMLTQEMLKVRILGASFNAEVPSNATLFATGNNVVISGDLGRRSLLCSLDAGVERPELREFDYSPTALARRERGNFVVAGLTMLRAYITAGRPAMASPLGSFEAWSGLVRNTVMWLGEADPCGTIETARASDPRLLQLAGVLDLWERIFGDETRRSVREVIREVSSFDEGDAWQKPRHPDFRDLLTTIAGDHNGINSRRLGRWLHAIQGRIVRGRRIVQAGLLAGLMTWKLELVER